MRTPMDCVICFARQSLDVARFCSSNEAVHEKILRQAMHMVGDLDFDQPPPVTAQKIHQMIREWIDDPDPYAESKRHFNEVMLNRLPKYRELVRRSSSPWETAVRLSIVGNTIDFGHRNDLSAESVDHAVELALTEPIFGKSPTIETTAVADGRADECPYSAQLKEDVAKAENILFLADNAGEIVCDRLWLEQFPLEKTTVAVAGKPILNDAMIDDARVVGLTDMVRVIDNGSDAPGTLLSDCSDAFLQAYEAADLVISKGLANFECLMEERKHVYFLFKAKCKVIADLVDVPVGSLVIRHHME